MRRLVCLTLLALSVLPAAAAASPSQVSIIEDGAIFNGNNQSVDPSEALAEAKALGADYLRVYVVWRRVSPAFRSDEVPADIDLRDPNAPGYDWAGYDRMISRARAAGLKILLTLGPEIPDWASEEPSACPHFVGGYRRLGQSCHWRPRPDLFSNFVTAAARRYNGQVDLWSLYNEPNLEHYLYPQLARVGRRSFVDLAAIRYRKLWLAGWRAIAENDPVNRDRVLFGETAAISSPMDTLYAAFCLNENGRPFRGSMRRRHGCTRPQRLPIGGIAHHPYNNFGRGSVFTKSFTKDSLPLPYTSRLNRLMKRAERYGRIPRGKSIYMTEFGFQSRPPDRRAQSLRSQARSINEADRLFFADRRVAAVAQFELYDAPEFKGEDVYQTGLRLIDGQKKPAWDAYRMPIVVSRLGRGRVEVWGQVRPAEGRVSPQVQVLRRGAWVTVTTPRTNPSGYFRFRIKAGRKTKWRTQWTAPGGETMFSRVASAGRFIRYLE